MRLLGREYILDPDALVVRIVLLGTGVQPIPPTGYGGIERSIAEFSEALRTAGHEPVIINAVRKGRMWDEYPFARALPRLLRNLHYEIIHASTPVVANRLAGMRTAFVYTSHSRHWFDRHGVRQYWGYFLEKRAVRKAAATVALTQRLARTIVSAVGRSVQSRIHVVPLGVDSDRFRPNWSERTGTVALGVGIVAPFKRWDLAVRATEKAGYTFRLAGPIPDATYAQRLRSMSSRDELLGELSGGQLREEYGRAAVQVHPSRVEILPGVVLQGLSAGLPVLGSEVVASTVDDGVTGFCAPPGADENSISLFLQQKLLLLAADPTLRRRVGEEGTRVARQRFAWPEVVRQHLKIYERVIYGSANPPGNPAS